VIGGSELAKEETAASLNRSAISGRGCGLSGTLFVLCAGLLFGGAAGAWFTAGEGVSLLVRGLQLATGSLAMGVMVAVAGSLLFGRNPIRWGMGVPVMVYLAGMLVALVTGREGSVGLLYGAPLFLGMTIAAGMVTAFLIDGIFGRPEAA
jgi:hypothetical protein